MKKKAQKQEMTTDDRDAHTPYNQAQSLDGRLVQKNISSVADIEIIPQKIQESIGKPIKLKVGSLLKLVANNREKYIQEIAPTFAEPDIVFKEKDNEKDILLFAKNIGEQQYFVNVNADYDNYFITISSSPKREQTLENKLKKLNEKDLLYRSPNFESYSPQKAFTGITSSTNKNGDTEIIPQELQKCNPKNRLMINIYGSAGVGKTTFAKKLQEFIVKYQKENLKYNKFEPQFNPALVGEYATMLIKDSKFDELGKEIAEAEAELKDEKNRSTKFI